MTADGTTNVIFFLFVEVTLLFALSFNFNF